MNRSAVSAGTLSVLGCTLIFAVVLTGNAPSAMASVTQGNGAPHEGGPSCKRTLTIPGRIDGDRITADVASQCPSAEVSGVLSQRFDAYLQTTTNGVNWRSYGSIYDVRQTEARLTRQVVYEPCLKGSYQYRLYGEFHYQEHGKGETPPIIERSAASEPIECGVETDDKPVTPAPTSTKHLSNIKSHLSNLKKRSGSGKSVYSNPVHKPPAGGSASTVQFPHGPHSTPAMRTAGKIVIINGVINHVLPTVNGGSAYFRLINGYWYHWEGNTPVRWVMLANGRMQPASVASVPTKAAPVQSVHAPKTTTAPAAKSTAKQTWASERRELNAMSEAQLRLFNQFCIANARHIAEAKAAARRATDRANLARFYAATQQRLNLGRFYNGVAQAARAQAAQPRMSYQAPAPVWHAPMLPVYQPLAPVWTPPPVVVRNPAPFGKINALTQTLNLTASGGYTPPPAPPAPAPSHQSHSQQVTPYTPLCACGMPGVPGFGPGDWEEMMRLPMGAME